MCNLLYHYTSMEKFAAIVNSDSFRLGSLLTMNDECDRKKGVCVFEEYLQTDRYLSKAINDLVNKNRIHELLLESLQMGYYSVSFGNSYNNEVLWERYAHDKVTKQYGMAIEINRNNFEKAINKRLCSIDPEAFTSCTLLNFETVHYGNDYDFVENTINSALNDLKQICSKEDGNDIDLLDSDNIELFIQYVAYLLSGIIKSSFWEPEQETRLLYKKHNIARKKYSDFLNYKPNDVGSTMLRNFQISKEEEMLGKLGLLVEQNSNYYNYLDLKYREFFIKGIVEKIYVREKERRDELISLFDEKKIQDIDVKLID